MKNKSTLERVLQDPNKRKSFEKKYREFLLSELISELMEIEKVSVRKLATMTNLSPTVIQEIKSGKRENPTFDSLTKLIGALGGEIVFKKGKKELAQVP
ncbi:helix-turn-helix domain-containing protein [Leptospira stimsonii]|uniref:Transcriptional regulator n=1 Tax=Leptospira stimsonii TaxID=2202203 RepID=A0A8B3CLQ4_9LEPT|nr:helix-turn-helix domain-containing protein [Leptospira stimsonii]RHX83207.1 transcriptional regulator [Leptospira stimsonii]